MEEESDSRKINNSFLRDHNYATEGIWKIELNSILTYINDSGGGGLLFRTPPACECALGVSACWCIEDSQTW